MTIAHAVILAAGRGSRMMPLTDAIPKPMAPFAGSTLIAEGIARLRARIPNIHVTIGYKKAMLARHVIENGATTVINTEGRSNSWWIFNTLLTQLDLPVLVLTCDNVVELDLEELERDYQEAGKPHCMLVPVRPVAGLEGDFIHHDNHVVREVNRSKPSDLYCSGIQILNPRRVSLLVSEGADFYDVWRQLIAHRTLKVARSCPRKWFSVDTVEQLNRLNALRAE